MRHQAWLIQRYYLKRCRAVRDTLEHEPVFALSSALGLMGIAPPETAVLDLGKEHIVVRNRDARRGHPANVACHAWSLLDDRIVIRIFDLYCTSPAATFAQFVRFNWFEETIILADRLTCRDERLRRATKQELMDFLDERKVYGGTPGVAFVSPEHRFPVGTGAASGCDEMGIAESGGEPSGRFGVWIGMA